MSAELSEATSRRQFIAASLAAAAIVPRTTESRQKWITVADAGKNKNGRIYPADALRHMAESARGSFVTREEDPTMGICTSTMGICTSARIDEDGDVSCQFRWFGEKVPIGAYIVPQGTGVLIAGDPSYVTEYRFRSFAIAFESAFQKATPLC